MHKQLEEVQQPREPVAASAVLERVSGGGGSPDLVSEIARTISKIFILRIVVDESNFIRRNRRLIFQQNARQLLRNVSLD